MYWKTVNNTLKYCLEALMDAEEFKDFRLVGGTALSLQLGHRMSVDIDLFTDADYGSVDFDAIDDFIRNRFGYADSDFGALPGIGRSYVIGTDRENAVKLDVYYNTEKFIRPALVSENIRMASLEDIVAMKIDVVSRGGRKKDFWDLHELLPDFTIDKMLKLHRERSHYTHNRNQILENFINFKDADEDFDPNCLKGKYWQFIKEDIEDAILRK